MNQVFEIDSPSWDSLRMDALEVASGLFSGAIDILEAHNLTMGEDYSMADILSLAKIAGDVYNTSLVKVASQDIVDALLIMVPDVGSEVVGVGQELAGGLRGVADAITTKVSSRG